MIQSFEKHGRLQLRIKSLMHFATGHHLNSPCLDADQPACFFANKLQINYQNQICAGATQLVPCAVSPKLFVLLIATFQPCV